MQSKYSVTGALLSAKQLEGETPTWPGLTDLDLTFMESMGKHTFFSGAPVVNML